MTGGTLAAAQAYIAACWHLLVANPKTKRPLTAHGLLDATSDIAIVAGWLRRWPGALLAGRTGTISGHVVLDIDVTESVNGWDVLEEMGVNFAPSTPMAHTPRGGTHCFFKHPGGHVKTTAGKLGRGLDVRGDGGYIILPPGPGRYWDPHYGPETPLAEMPAWMAAAEKTTVDNVHGSKPERPTGNAAQAVIRRLDKAAAAALERAIRAILDASEGSQRDRLNGQAYFIGQLVAGHEIPAAVALKELDWAAAKVRSFDPRRPWRPGECQSIVHRAFLDGQRQPRNGTHGR